MAQHLMMSRLIATVATGLALTIARAYGQFPPPAVNLRSDLDGCFQNPDTAGWLAGDHQFTSRGGGQAPSSGDSVNALSQPLADISLGGSFAEDHRATRLGTTGQGDVCGAGALAGDL